MSGSQRNPVTGYLWAGLAVLTCPCHLPILAAVLAGTTAGAFLGEHWAIAALGLIGLFVLSVARALRPELDLARLRGSLRHNRINSTESRDEAYID